MNRSSGASLYLNWQYIHNDAYLYGDFNKSLSINAIQVHTRYVDYQKSLVRKQEYLSLWCWFSSTLTYATHIYTFDMWCFLPTSPLVLYICHNSFYFSSCFLVLIPSIPILLLPCEWSRPLELKFVSSKPHWGTFF